MGTGLVESDVCFWGGRGAARGDSKGNGTDFGDSASGRFKAVGVGAARGDSNGSTGVEFCVGVFGSAGSAVVKNSRPTPCGLGIGDGILLLSSELVLRPLVLDSDKARLILSVALGEGGAP